MYLKKIEIAGFKSFADRTVIDFDQGLTAIVGPNGSGKSNITEAIRWVLGEQSAKNLRGGKMPDVIFAGSDARKSLNRAEVTVVLDNAERHLPLEFNEVSITRRFNRNGDSDFYINKQRCRLKDITELFMDSGLGKESFSIISQGKVEAIFNSKPEDRRGIFEEAAGVLKYKQRKKQAEQKLFETEDNLNRVQDIVYELENQLVPLRTQSEDARRFLQFREELTEIEVGVYVVEMDRLKEKWTEQSAIAADLTQSIDQLSESIQINEHRVKELREQRQQLDELIDQTQRQLLHVTESYEQAEGQKNVLAERSKHAETTISEHRRTKEALVDKEKKVQVEYENFINEKKQKESLLVETNKQLRQLEQELVLYQKPVKEQLEEYRAEYVDLMQQQANLRNELKHLEREYQQETQKNQKDMQRYEQLINEQQELAEKKEELVQCVADTSEKTEYLRRSYVSMKQQMDEKKDQLSKQEKQMFDAMGILQQAKARQKSLQELQESYAGFYQGVRSILQVRKQFSGIKGAVAELIHVPKEYAIGIETALGSASQNVVVEDEKTARECITHLKQHRLGRATFMPLSTMKPKYLPEAVRRTIEKVPGFIGVASELVSFDQEIEVIVQNILGMTVIARDLQSANQLAKAAQYKYRIVSLEGDVMNPGGAMTGGASKKGNQGNLFTQANELDELTEKIQKMDERLKEAEQQVRVLKQELLRLEHELEEIRLAGEQSRLDEQEWKNQQELLESQVKQAFKEQKVFEYDAKELQEFLSQYEKDKTRWNEALATLEKRKEELDQAMSQVDQLEKENEQKRETLQQEIQRIQANSAVVQEQVRHLEQQSQEKAQQLEETIREIKQLEEQIAFFHTNQFEHTETQESVQEKMERLQSEKEHLQTQLSESKANRVQIQEAIAVLDQELLDCNKEHQVLLNKKSAVEVDKNRLEMGLDSRLQYLQEEYQLTYEAGKEHYPLALELSLAKEKVKQIKAEMQMIGPVNLNAIEQFEQVNERYSFLVEQRDDLLAAKESLFETMNEMDEVVKERFLEVFEAIRDQFVKVFPAMFGGGHAELRLTDPQHLLETGIEIIAQPPGKKLQNLSLLSGGERALTAIALLFSIIQVRPVPFCILDEVEAALDEANVARFGHYLSKFEKKTQFIVITHRKGTMEAADVLYGVTMQESGVSKMVSVRLEEVNERGDFAKNEA